MIYIVRVYEDGEIYEYEYGNEKHTREHMAWEQGHTELYGYRAGREWVIDSAK